MGTSVNMFTRYGLSVRICFLTFVLPVGAVAVDPGTAIQTAAVVKESAPGLTRAGKGIAEVPWQLAQCLRLPLGLVQMVFAPLPEVAFMDGLKNTGKGIAAPFKLGIAILEMPYEVVGGLGNAVSS